MRQPNYITSFGLDNLKDCAALIDGRYVIARPYAMPSPIGRWRMAWMVLTGKADCLVWPGQEDR